MILRDISEEATQRGVKGIASLLEHAVDKGTLSAAEKDTALLQIYATTDLAQLSNSDFIIVAATENS